MTKYMLMPTNDCMNWVGCNAYQIRVKKNLNDSGVQRFLDSLSKRQ